MLLGGKRMNRNRIVSRLFIRGKLVLQSPLIIGNGENEQTDVDVLKDHEGKPYIPGTTLAGVMRHYLANDKKMSDESPELQYLFGRGFDLSREQETTTSQIYVSDATLLSNQFTISVRDGVKINDFKAAYDGSKYDYEVIEPGSIFDLKIEVLLRERDEYYIKVNGKQQLISNSLDQSKVKHLVAVLLQGLESEQLAFGAKTSRGFGRVKLTDLKVYEIDHSDYKALLDFDFDSFTTNVNYNDWILEEWESSHIELEADLELLGSLCIRSHRLDADDADFAMLKRHDGRAVIPGTSWAGVFRHHVHRLLKELGLNQNITEQIENELFGFVDKGIDKSTYSKLQFHESVFENSNYRRMSRTTIDRFTGGALKHSLFTGEYLNGGKTTLTIRLEKKYKNYLGLVMLVLEDLHQGLVAVGGETSVGRGMFKVNHIRLDGGEDTGKDKGKIYEKLYNMLFDRGEASA